MSLAKFELFNVRNIRRAQLVPSPNINLVIGENASGKTALLEGIFILGRGKSFRTAHTEQVVNFDAESLVVTGQSRQTAGNLRQLGVRADGKNMEIRISGKQVRSCSELAYSLPLQVILPNSHRLLEMGPQLRREFVDWGVFHVNPDFLLVWRKYRRALSQRNVLLKAGAYSDTEVWEHEMAQYGTIVNDFRTKYIEQLAPLFSEIAERFLSFRSYELKHVAGWDVSRTLMDVLANDRPRDMRFGFTHSGPHKGDWRLLVDGRPARDYASRGQIKILVIALKLAQIAVLQKITGIVGCILIDDLASEIDGNNRQKVFQYLGELNSQTFLTTTDDHYFGNVFSQNSRKFHVERGQITHV